MKKQINSTIKAHLIRSAFYVFLLFAMCTIPFALGQRNGTKQNMAKRGNALPGNTIVVTNTNDNGPGSLRQALVDANDGDTIDATGVSGTILLTTGELQITHNVTINGPSAGNLAVDGNHSRVFENFGSNVTLSGFTITNGLGGLGVGGGGILNHGGLALSDSIVSSSSTFDANGAGIENDGTLTVTNSIVTGNVACCTLASGGGIANGGNLTVTNSTITGNGAVTDGGGISSAGNLTVMNSTISGNWAGVKGGGIENDQAALTVSNSTISGNSSDFVGGGISNGDAPGTSVTVSNSTISDNSATGNGGGIYNEGSAEVHLGSTILEAGGSGENIFNDGGTVTSHGYNLSSDDGGGVLTGPGDQINTNPMLGPLQDNGGPTFTHALLPGSPAIDTGDPNFTPPPLYDQRGPGFDRVSNGRIDIGSFEAQPRAKPRPRPTPHPRPTH